MFGEWRPWWGYQRRFDTDEGYQPPKTWSLAGKTDATGAHVMHLDFLSLNPAMPMSVVANAIGHRRQSPDLDGIGRR